MEKENSTNAEVYLPGVNLPPTPAASTDIAPKEPSRFAAFSRNTDAGFSVLPPSAMASGSSAKSTSSPESSQRVVRRNVSQSSISNAGPQSKASQHSKKRPAPPGSIRHEEMPAKKLPPPPSRSRKIIQVKPKSAQSQQVISATDVTTPLAASNDNLHAQTTASKATASKSTRANANKQKSKRSNAATTAASGSAIKKVARKTAHSIIERRRRSKMNEEFGVLKDMIPACRGVEMHKLAILQASIEYLRYLEQCMGEIQDHSRVYLRERDHRQYHTPKTSDNDFSYDDDRYNSVEADEDEREGDEDSQHSHSQINLDESRRQSQRERTSNSKVGVPAQLQSFVPEYTAEAYNTGEITKFPITMESTYSPSLHASQRGTYHPEASNGAGVIGQSHGLDFATYSRSGTKSAQRSHATSPDFNRRNRAEMIPKSTASNSAMHSTELNTGHNSSSIPPALETSLPSASSLSPSSALGSPLSSMNPRRNLAEPAVKSASRIASTQASPLILPQAQAYSSSYSQTYGTKPQSPKHASHSSHSNSTSSELDAEASEALLMLKQQSSIEGLMSSGHPQPDIEMSSTQIAHEQNHDAKYATEVNSLSEPSEGLHPSPQGRTNAHNQRRLHSAAKSDDGAKGERSSKGISVRDLLSH